MKWRGYKIFLGWMNEWMNEWMNRGPRIGSDELDVRCREFNCGSVWICLQICFRLDRLDMPYAAGWKQGLHMCLVIYFMAEPCPPWSTMQRRWRVMPYLNQTYRLVIKRGVTKTWRDTVSGRQWHVQTIAWQNLLIELQSEWDNRMMFCSSTRCFILQVVSDMCR